MTEKQRGRKAMLWSVAAMHVWGTALVWKDVVQGGSTVTADMFSAVCLGIAANLAVIAGDKGLMEFVQSKSAPREETTTSTTIIKEPQSEQLAQERHPITD